MKAITVATHAERYFDVLKESAERNNIDLVVLGWGEKWKGFTWKFNLLIDYLKSCDDNEIVLFIDGYDVFFIRSEYDIINTFLKLKNKNPDAKIFVGRDGYPPNKYHKYFYDKVFPDSCNNYKIYWLCKRFIIFI